MSKMKRILCAFLAAVMMFGAAACAESREKENDAVGSSADVSETSAETDKYDEARSLYSALPDVDYEDGDFTICAQKGVGSSEKEIWVEQMDGEAINDAVYTRNSLVGERCRCVIQLYAGDVQSTIKQSVLSDDETYKLAFPNLATAGTMAQNGYFLNYLDFENVNIKEAWWDQGTAALEIGGKVYFMSGDINILDNDVTYILLFNKKLFEDVGLAEPYQAVRDGEWTIDMFSEMIKNVTNDTNGDGKFTDEDTYGYVTTNQGPTTFFYGSQLMYITFDEEKLPELTLNEEKTQLLLEKVAKIFTEDNCTRVPSDVAVGKEMFMADRVLFYGEVLSYIINVREMETPFGVLPIPKYDTLQDGYYTYCESNSSTCGVPMSVKDVENVTAVLEAMAIQSYINVTPAYYDISLQRKYTRDDESADMLDIALSHRVYDLVRVYTNIGLNDVFTTLAKKGSTDFASSYAKKQKSAQRAIDKICSAFADMEY